MTAADRHRDVWLAPGDARLPLAVHHLPRPIKGLWFAGASECLTRGIRIGIVGSRLPRADSVAFAERIAAECARAGMTIVSGLAMGIDGAAHRAALDAGGASIAVIAGGLGSIHPSRHVGLATRIAGAGTAGGVVAGHHPAACGAVLSEYSPGVERCHGWQFQMRNRIIAALSDYLVVIQAKPKSGSMGTAHAALDLGVPIGVVPSAPNDECYTGSIDLIRDGADSVVDGASVAGRLELHGVMKPGFRAAFLAGARIDLDRRGAWSEVESSQLVLELNPAQASLLKHLRVPRLTDDLVDATGLQATELRRLLVDLESAGRIHMRSDGAWAPV